MHEERALGSSDVDADVRLLRARVRAREGEDAAEDSGHGRIFGVSVGFLLIDHPRNIELRPILAQDWGLEAGGPCGK